MVTCAKVKDGGADPLDAEVQVMSENVKYVRYQQTNPN